MAQFLVGRNNAIVTPTLGRIGRAYSSLGKWHAGYFPRLMNIPSRGMNISCISQHRSKYCALTSPKMARCKHDFKLLELNHLGPLPFDFVVALDGMNSELSGFRFV